MEYVLILIAAILADNFVFTKFLGIEQSFVSSDKPTSALAGGGLVTVVSLVSGELTYLLYVFVFFPLGISFLTLPVGVLLIAAVVAGFGSCRFQKGKIGGSAAQSISYDYYQRSYFGICFSGNRTRDGSWCFAFAFPRCGNRIYTSRSCICKYSGTPWPLCATCCFLRSSYYDCGSCVGSDGIFRFCRAAFLRHCQDKQRRE